VSCLFRRECGKSIIRNKKSKVPLIVTEWKDYIYLRERYLILDSYAQLEEAVK